MTLFNPCMKFEFFGGQMTSSEMVKNIYLWTLFIKCHWLFRWIKRDKWDIIHFNSNHRIFFSVFYFDFDSFFQFKTIVRRSALSVGHSDPEPSSVSYHVIFITENSSFFSILSLTYSCNCFWKKAMLNIYFLFLG